MAEIAFWVEGDEVAGMSSLFSSLQLGAVRLPNRVLMAPLTRCRAGVGNVPQALNALYYQQRAGAGLIIAEATAVTARGFGYPNTPGIFTQEQVAGVARGDTSCPCRWRTDLPAVVACGADFPYRVSA